MISKAKIKFIKSLQIKKYRKQEQCFIVEGPKSITELSGSGYRIRMLVAVTDFLEAAESKGLAIDERIEVSAAELKGLGEFQTNESAIAVVEMKPNRELVPAENEFALVLDDIRDPGNLGTIIRTADWYGINNIITSTETADFYNPKVIASSMGSFTRTEVFYTELADYLNKSRHTVFGTFLDGEDVHKTQFGSGGLIVIGNESRGISPEVARFVSKRITIPRYGQAESLNAAIATAVVLDNLRRH